MDNPEILVFIIQVSGYKFLGKQKDGSTITIQIVPTRRDFIGNVFKISGLEGDCFSPPHYVVGKAVGVSGLSELSKMFWLQFEHAPGLRS